MNGLEYVTFHNTAIDATPYATRASERGRGHLRRPLQVLHGPSAKPPAFGRWKSIGVCFLARSIRRKELPRLDLRHADGPDVRGRSSGQSLRWSGCFSVSFAKIAQIVAIGPGHAHSVQSARLAVGLSTGGETAVFNGKDDRRLRWRCVQGSFEVAAGLAPLVSESAGRG